MVKARKVNIDAVPTVLPDGRVPPKKRMGRPPLKRKKRPEVLPMFAERRKRTAEEKAIIVGIIIDNPTMSFADIAIKVKTPESSIKRWYSEFLERRSAQTTEITPAHDDDVIDMDALSPNRLARLAVYEMAMGGSPCRHTLESFAQLCKEADLPASKATVWWDFQIFGIKLKRRPKRPWCGEQGVEAWLMARLSFARVMKTFSPQHCVFIDECYLSTNDLKNFEWCLPAHEPTPINDPRWVAKCHVLGVIGYGGFKLFVNLHEHSHGPRGGFTQPDYINVIKLIIVPALNRHYGYLNRNRLEGDKIRPVIIQDGAPAHKGIDVIKAFEDATCNGRLAGYKVMEGWPGYSPDFNCIENFWGLCKRRLNPDLVLLRSNTAANRKLIWELAQEHFKDIKKDEIDRQIMSFTTRMLICEERNGGYTGY